MFTPGGIGATLSPTSAIFFTTVPENPGLAVVCVANAEVPAGAAIGNWLLVGPLTFDPDGLARADISKSIDQLRKVPSLAARTDQIVADLLRVMQDQYDLTQDIERSGAVTLASLPSRP